MVSKQEKEEWLPEHGLVKPDDAFSRLHKLSIRNRELLELEGSGSCFSCFSYVNVGHIRADKNIVKKWTDNQQTAICPHCGIDSILPGHVHPNLLQEMYDRYFEFEI